MRLTWVIVALVLVVAIAGCSKGNVITGNTVANPKQANNENPAPVVDDAPVAKTEDPEETETVLDDSPTEVKNYSDLAGTCEVTSRGDIRVIDEAGRKTIYRDECIGGTVVEYTCNGNTLATKLVNCPNGCIVENYFGKCA